MRDITLRALDVLQAADLIVCGGDLVAGRTSSALVVAGHIHMQADRRVGDRRFVVAGSVGRPYEGVRGAFWALLDDDVAGIMLTNPSTLGLFEDEIVEIAEAVHDVGGLLYYVGGGTCSGIVRWDGHHWDDLGGGVLEMHCAYALHTDKSGLFQLDTLTEGQR